MDGYAGYNRVLDLRDNAPIQLAYCWALRQAKSAPKVATFKTWLDQTGLQVSAKSPMPSRAQSATSRCNAKTHSSRVMTQAPRTERCSRH